MAIYLYCYFTIYAFSGIYWQLHANKEFKIDFNAYFNSKMSNLFFRIILEKL